MYFMFLIPVGLFWIFGHPRRHASTHWLTRHLVVALWYTLFCLAASISFNSWLFSRELFSDFSGLSESCKENAVLLFAMVQVELLSLVLGFSLMNKHFYDFCHHIKMYIDLLTVLAPWAVLALSYGTSVLKERFLTRIMEFKCTSDSSFEFISNVYWSGSVMILAFAVPKLLILLYLAVSGILFHRRYRFMSKLDKGLLMYFFLFFFETLFHLHYQMFRAKASFAVWDVLSLEIAWQPVQLLLFLPVVAMPCIIYKITEPIKIC